MSPSNESRNNSKRTVNRGELMITKYVIHYKARPITEPLSLPDAVKKIEKLRCLFLGLTIVPVEVAE